jgi:hypothetical protein
MCTLSPCDNPNCLSQDLSLTVYPIDTGLDSVEWDEKSLKLRWRDRMLPKEHGGVTCHVDVSRATVHSNETTAYAREIVERVQKLMTSEVLDRFHDVICEARHLPVDRATALPEGWIVGDPISFGNAQKTARLELIEEAGRTWAAIDDHCPRLGCPCATTFIEVFRVVQKPFGLHDSLGTIMVAPDGNWDLKPVTREALVLRDVWRRLGERWGDVPRELARRRDIVRDVFGPMVQAKEQMHSTAPTPPSVAPTDRTAQVSKQSRNDPCACGSGKKNKRCCGRNN